MLWLSKRNNSFKIFLFPKRHLQMVDFINHLSVWSGTLPSGNATNEQTRSWLEVKSAKTSKRLEAELFFESSSQGSSIDEKGQKGSDRAGGWSSLAWPLGSKKTQKSLSYLKHVDSTFRSNS